MDAWSILTDLYASNSPVMHPEPLPVSTLFLHQAHHSKISVCLVLEVFFIYLSFYTFWYLLGWIHWWSQKHEWYWLTKQKSLVHACSSSSTTSPRHFIYLFIFKLFCLGHFPSQPPSPISSPPHFQAEPVLPLSLILLKKRQKHNKEDKVFLLVELRIAIQKYS
jgi:hypothetical protein